LPSGAIIDRMRTNIHIARTRILPLNKDCMIPCDNKNIARRQCLASSCTSFLFFIICYYLHTYMADIYILMTIVTRSLLRKCKRQKSALSNQHKAATRSIISVIDKRLNKLTAKPFTVWMTVISKYFVSCNK